MDCSPIVYCKPIPIKKNSFQTNTMPLRTILSI
nr:MAG TPA: hypothetical protein [Caudoviricetes sp.]